MENVSLSAWSRLARWFVPVAAVLAFSAWLYVAPPGLMGKLDAIGYAVCHRIDSHSLHIGSLQLPLCARCTGEFNAAAIALIFQGLVSPRKSQFPNRGILAVLAVLFAAFAFDGSNSYLALLRTVSPGAFGRIPNLYVTTNVTRVFTGSGMGLAMGAILFPMYNQSVWRTPTPQAALTWRGFGVLAGILLLIDAGNPDGKPCRPLPGCRAQQPGRPGTSLPGFQYRLDHDHEAGQRL